MPKHEFARKVNSFPWNLSKAYQTQTQHVQYRSHATTQNQQNECKWFDKTQYSNKHLFHNIKRQRNLSFLVCYTTHLEASYSINEYAQS